MRWLLAVVIALGSAGGFFLTANGAGVGVQTNVCPDPVQPEITDPPNGTVTKTPSIAIRGTATGGTLVTVFRNGSDAGSALVNAEGDWELTISLLPGENSLVAGTCTPSDPVEVTLETDQPAPRPGPGPADPGEGRAAPPDQPGADPGQPGQSASGPAGPGTGPRGEAVAPALGVSPLMLISAERSIIRGIVDESLDFPAIVYGGKPAYRVTWEWGDGNRTKLTVEDARKFTGRHAYVEPGKYQARVTVTDAENQTARYQFIADVIPERLPAAGAPGGRPLSHYLIAGAASLLLILGLILLILRKRRGRREPSNA